MVFLSVHTKVTFATFFILLTNLILCGKILFLYISVNNGAFSTILTGNAYPPSLNGYDWSGNSKKRRS